MQQSATFLSRLIALCQPYGRCICNKIIWNISLLLKSLLSYCLERILNICGFLGTRLFIGHLAILLTPLLGSLLSYLQEGASDTTWEY